MGASGNRNLNRLRERLREVRVEFRDELAKRLGEKSLEILRNELSSATDPDGKPFPAPLRKGGLPMNRTGALAAGFSLQWLPGGFKITNNATDTTNRKTPRPYAIYAQGRAGFFWRRRHSGKAWRNAFRSVARRLIKEKTQKLK